MGDGHRVILREALDNCLERTNDASPSNLTISTLPVFARVHLAQASPDLLREMLTTFINALMSADADAVCGAGYAKVSEERINRRNGYRPRQFDTRAGTLEVAIPKLASWVVFPRLVAGASPPSRA